MELDDLFLYNTVQNQVNIFSELTRLKKALKPFKIFIGNQEPDGDRDLPIFQHESVVIEQFSRTKSKLFYAYLVKIKACRPLHQENTGKIF